MAKQVVTMLTDDLDGGEADETVTFGLDGTIYEIDLSEKNVKVLRDFLGRYVNAGTRTGRMGATGVSAYAPRGRGQGNNSGARANKDLNTTIRTWAADNGHSVAERGRIPQHVINAYRKGIPAEGNRQAELPVTEQTEPRKAERAKPVPAVSFKPEKAAPAKAIRSTRAKATA